MKADKMAKETKDAVEKPFSSFIAEKEAKNIKRDSAMNNGENSFCIGGKIPIKQNSRCVVKVEKQDVHLLNPTEILAEREEKNNQNDGHSLLRQEYLQSRKMEAMGELASGIAHDFNNFLTAIIGYQHLLQQRLQNDSKSRHYCEQVMALAEEAKYLTQALLTFGRKQAFQPKRLNLNVAVRDTAKFLKRLIGEDIELKTDLCVQPLPVLAVNSQLEQILMNLVTNASDAMPQGGELRIVTDSICKGRKDLPEDICEENRGYALLAVSDTGTGIDEMTKSRIFEPFFTTKVPGKGTGLGLATVRSIVNQHSGHIRVDSEPGKGTTFSIYLPLLRELETKEAIRAKDAFFPQGTETLLLAEDDRAVRESLKVLLERQGYRVIEAEDGDEALDIYLQHGEEIDALILDVVMPKRNGKEVYDIISKGMPDIKHLFISGYTSDTIAGKGVEEGVNLVQKPLSLAKFLTTLREILD